MAWICAKGDNLRHTGRQFTSSGDNLRHMPLGRVSAHVGTILACAMPWCSATNQWTNAKCQPTAISMPALGAWSTVQCTMPMAWPGATPSLPRKTLGSDPTGGKFPTLRGANKRPSYFLTSSNPFLLTTSMTGVFQIGTAVRASNCGRGKCQWACEKVPIDTSAALLYDCPICVQTHAWRYHLGRRYAWPGKEMVSGSSWQHSCHPDSMSVWRLCESTSSDSTRWK